MVQEVVILALAAWRLAHMLVEEAGPGGVFARLRYRAGVRSIVVKDGQGNPVGSKAAMNWLAEGLTCTWCVSVWAAALLALPLAPVRWARLVLAGAAGAVIAHEATERLRR